MRSAASETEMARLLPLGARAMLLLAGAGVWALVMAPSALLAWQLAGKTGWPGLGPLWRLTAPVPGLVAGFFAAFLAACGIWRAGIVLRGLVLFCAVLLLGMAFSHLAPLNIAAAGCGGLTCLLVSGRLNQIDPRQWEAAMGCGAGPVQAFRLVVLPALLRPAGLCLLAGGFWVFAR